MLDLRSPLSRKSTAYIIAYCTILTFILATQADVSHIVPQQGYHYEHPQYQLNIPSFQNEVQAPTLHTGFAPMSYAAILQQHQHSQAPHPPSARRHQPLHTNIFAASLMRGIEPAPIYEIPQEISQEYLPAAPAENDGYHYDAPAKQFLS